MSRSGRIVVIMAAVLAIVGIGAMIGIGAAQLRESEQSVAKAEAPPSTLGRPASLSVTAPDFSCQSGQYFQVGLPNTSQNGCPGTLGFCCEETYISCDDLSAPCSGQIGTTVYVLARPSSSENCCDCSHLACIAVIMGTEDGYNLSQDDCILGVEDCFATCEACLNELAARMNAMQQWSV